MKVSNIRQIQKLDPEDIQDLPGDVEREIKRKRLINKFLKWSYGEKKLFSETSNEEGIVVKRQYVYKRLLYGFGAFANFAFYNCFLTGIYNFRTKELMDMRRIPFTPKLALSTGLAFYMCKKLWDNNIYEAELYQVALKYREKYDKEFQSANPEVQTA